MTETESSEPYFADETKPGTLLGMCSISLVMVAVLVGYSAYGMDTSVSAPIDLSGIGGASIDRVNNNGLMQQQLMLYLLSLCLGLSGSAGFLTSRVMRVIWDARR